MDQSVLNWLLMQSPGLVVCVLGLYFMGKALIAANAQILDLVSKLAACEEQKIKDRVNST